MFDHQGFITSCEPMVVPSNIMLWELPNDMPLVPIQDKRERNRNFKENSSYDQDSKELKIINSYGSTVGMRD